MTTTSPHILILGGGYAGYHVARRLRRAARAGRIRVTVVEPRPYLTYKPLLPEVAGGHTNPRDVTVSLARRLTDVTLIGGAVESVSCSAKTAVVRSSDGIERALFYDHIVFAVGAVTKTMPIPGLAEHAVGCETVEEAVFLRNQVLDRIQFAASTTDEVARDHALRFTFVGGGYTGVETICELQQLATHAHRLHPSLSGARQEWTLIEAGGRVAAELPPSLSAWTLDLLRQRGITVKLNTEMRSCENGVVETSDGESAVSDTIVWTAGVTPNPVLDASDAPRGSTGHVQANARLQVVDNDGLPLPGIWAVGDNAEIPDLTAPQQPAFCPPTAQHALRQARQLADNLQRAVDGEDPAEYRHRSLGTMASYGAQSGAADVKRLPLHGFPAWALDKVYHGLATPDPSRRVRIVANWVANVAAARDLTSTSAARHPRTPFTRAFAAQADKTSRH